MRILIIGGMHGNEPLGLKVVQLFETSPINGVDVLLANKRAIEKRSRFIKQDLNRSFPGKSAARDYEQRRAAQILTMTKRYDLVLDFHNTHCPENDCGFVGESADKKLSDVAWLLELNKIIVADYDCINKFAPKCLSIEVSINSPLNKPELWYERIRMLSVLEGFTARPQIERYRFVYRMTLEDKKKLRLNEHDLKAFQPMDDALAKAMGLTVPVYPIFVGDGYTPYNYGGVLKRVN